MPYDISDIYGLGIFKSIFVYTLAHCNSLVKGEHIEAQEIKSHSQSPTAYKMVELLPSYKTIHSH